MSQYDVFISYSSKDKIWVHTRLVDKLISHSFKVLTDSDFVGGAFSDEQMENAVQSSRHVIAVMSNDFFLSGWTKLETAMTRLLDPGAIKRKLIPVLLYSTDIPLRFRVMTYRDLRNDDKQEWERLINDLK